MQSEATQATVRPDLDIEEDISTFLRTFAPLKAARPYIACKSTMGHVKLSGCVGSAPARYVLLENIGKIQGVVDCDSSELYDDEQIRMNVGPFMPENVFATVRYGAVVITGYFPDIEAARALIGKLKGVPGVRKVGIIYNDMVIEE